MKLCVNSKKRLVYEFFTMREGAGKKKMDR
jgi:hypothetical protein